MGSVSCIHEAPHQEYRLITEQYVDRNDLVYYDGPVIGTAECRSCGQLFLFMREDDGRSRTWIYLPISASLETQMLDGVIDLKVQVKALRSYPHMVVVETPFESELCKVDWVPGERL